MERTIRLLRLVRNFQSEALQIGSGPDRHPSVFSPAFPDGLGRVVKYRRVVDDLSSYTAVAWIHLLDQREATVVAGLEMALEKYGMRLEVTGTTEQKIVIAQTAARHGVRAEFSERAVQQVYEKPTVAADAAARA
jgi:hypothetical protein